MQGGNQGADRGLEVAVRGCRPGWNHDSAGIADQGRQFLGVGRSQIHQLNLGIRLADAVGDGLTDSV